VSGGGLSAQGVMRSIVIVEMGEGVDGAVELGEIVGRVVDGVELVAPGTVGAFDGAVELGGLGRQDVEREVALLAGGLELGLELGAAVDLEGVDLVGQGGEELVEELGGGLGGGAAEGMG